MNTKCTACHTTYGEPWKSLTQSYNERECEECHASVCVECWTLDRLCPTCQVRRDAQEARDERDLRAMRLMRKYGISVKCYPTLPAVGWSLNLDGLALPGIGRRWRRKIYNWWYKKEDRRGEFLDPADLILAAVEAAGLPKEGDDAP